MGTVLQGCGDGGTANEPAPETVVTGLPDGWVDASAKFGLSGSTTADQRNALIAMRNWVAANAFAGTIVLPPGDIWFTGPIDWTAARPARPYYLTSDDRYVFPTLRGAGYGATRLRMLGAPNNDAGMRWFAGDSGVAAGITRVAGVALQNIDFYGAGRSFQATTLSSPIDGYPTPTTTMHLSSAIAQPGDAVAVRLDAGQGGFLVWATVQAVSGTGPQTITIDSRQAILVDVRSGSTVLVAKQTRILQFGGVRTDRSTICQEIEISGCRFFESLSAVAVDDVTQLFFGPRCVWQGVNFNVEYGYNVDTVQFQQPYWGSDRADLTGTCTQGSKVITRVGNPLSLRPGDHIADLTALPVLQFPENTVVTQVDGATVTVSEPYEGSTGIKTLAAFTGVLVSNGPNESPFLGAFAGNSKTNFTDTEVVGFVAGRVQALAHLGDTIGGPFIATGYVEASKRVLLNGYEGGVGDGRIAIRGLFVEKSQYLTGEAFHDRIGTGRWDIAASAVSPTSFPMLNGRVYSRIHLQPGWSWGGQTLMTIRDYAVPAIPIGNQGEVLDYNFGGGGVGSGGEGRSVGGQGVTWARADAAGTVGPIPWAFVSLVELTLVGDAIIPIGPGWFYAGQRVRLLLAQDATGGRALTFATGFVSASGTALGSLPTGLPHQSMALEFECLDNGNLMQLLTPTPVWV